MPRQARKLSSTGIYHIMLRGINRQQIFEDKEDYRKFIKILEKCKKASEFKLYSYCLMRNHVHLIIKVEKEPLDVVFKRICGRYAYWFNTKYQRVGHLFQDRFRSEPIENETYILNVLRYIHQNPIKAGYSKEIKEYPYSSYNCYVEENNCLVDIDFVLNFINIKQFEKHQNIIEEGNYLDICEQKNRVTEKQAEQIIIRISKCKNVSEFQCLEINNRNKYIEELKKEGLSIRQISKLTGISKGIVERN